MPKSPKHSSRTISYLKPSLKAFFVLFCIGHLEPVVGPAAKLHVAVLVVEGEPGDVNLTGGHEDAGGDVGALALRGHHHICWVGPIKCFTGTEGELRIRKSKSFH